MRIASISPAWCPFRLFENGTLRAPLPPKRRWIVLFPVRKILRYVKAHPKAFLRARMQQLLCETRIFHNFGQNLKNLFYKIPKKNLYFQNHNLNTGFDKKVPRCIFLTPSGNTAATKLYVVLLWTVYYSR